MKAVTRIESANVHFNERGVPIAADFDDPYFSLENGLEESRYVFLQGNDLQYRFANQKTFTIVETGFGAGLNFLAAWQLWREQCQPEAVLNYVSIEQHPLSLNDLKRSLNLWPELAELANRLIEDYPLPLAGTHELNFGNVRLHLIYDDALSALSEQDAQANAWFLDGFSPIKNGDMWSGYLFKQIARLSGAETTLSTYTAASSVRKELLACGFEVKKRKGFAQKREMLTACMSEPRRWRSKTPWYESPDTNKPEKVVIIGAGIAGASMAYALSKHGINSTVIGQASIASGASGNPAGIVSPKETADDSMYGRFYRQAFLLSRQWIDECGVDVISSGVAQLDYDSTVASRHKKIIAEHCFPESYAQFVDQSVCGKQSGLPVNADALFYAQALTVSPIDYCQKLFNQSKCSFIKDSVSSLRYADKQWRVYAQGQCIASATHCIIATAAIPDWLKQYLPLQTSPQTGQLSWLESNDLEQLKQTICYQGYIASVGDKHLLGATYEDNTSLQPMAASDQENLDALASVLKKPIDVVNCSPARRSTRWFSDDRLPIIGAVPDLSSYKKTYAGLKRGFAGSRMGSAAYHTGLYVSLAHGSRGLTSAALAADWIAKDLAGQPNAVHRSIRHMTHPARFFIKNLLTDAIDSSAV